MAGETQEYASGNWLVGAGNEAAFADRWNDFLEWTKEAAPGFVSASLIRDTGEPRHFLSISGWESAAARDAWKSNPGFAEKLMACRALCEEFSASDYQLAAHVSA